MLCIGIDDNKVSSRNQPKIFWSLPDKADESWLDAAYRDDQWCDSAGKAGEQPADIQHPHVLRRDDDGETKDERQRAEHQTELPADLLHHPAAQQAARRCSHCHNGLNNEQHKFISFKPAKVLI